MNSGIRITRLSGYVRSPSRNQPYGWPMKKLWVKKRETFQTLADQFMCSPDFMDLAAETRKDYVNIQAKFYPFLGKLTLIKLNQNTSAVTWISAACPAELRPTGKRVFFRGYSAGVMSGLRPA
jgi:hypothetical protein